jgi:hypothetical protein
VAWSQQPTGKNWSQFHRHNMQRWNPYEKVLNVNNVGNLLKKWSFKTGSGVFSSPAVVNGVVYVGSWDGTVSALKARNGALLWSYATGKRLGVFLARGGEWGGVYRLVRHQRVREIAFLELPKSLVRGVKTKVIGFTLGKAKEDGFLRCTGTLQEV